MDSCYGETNAVRKTSSLPETHDYIAKLRGIRGDSTQVFQTKHHPPTHEGDADHHDHVVSKLAQQMATYSRNYATNARARSLLFPLAACLALCSFTAIILLQVNYFVSHTKTVAGHNLDPTPWHLFPPKQFNDGSRYTRASRIIQCSYLSCSRTTTNKPAPQTQTPHNTRTPASKCPSFFRWIHHDLEPWARSGGISYSNLMEAKKSAAFRVIIVGGKLFVDFYYACVQSRTMFTIWGLLHLLDRYPGMVPDVDIMFDCMDRPVVNRTEYAPGSTWPPPPLFRYCTTKQHYDIPFPDWSFWGWPEVNLRPWDEEFSSIKQGSQNLIWKKKFPRAYWKGNPDVLSPIRTEMMRCNHSRKWGAQIMRQNWVEEANKGYEQSKLSNQCRHRYKIYAEGFAWSVSLKYILSCGSLALLISPEYEDFFSRGLVPKENFWPVSLYPDLCASIKYAVDWGNHNPSAAEAIGKRGQEFMADLPMERVYDYMYHLITVYSKLLKFKPSPPSSAQEVCLESLLCFADPKQSQFLERSTTSPSSSFPCTLPQIDIDIISSWLHVQRRKTK